LSELTKWIVVAGGLGFATVGVFIAVAPRRVNEALGRFHAGHQIQYPAWYVRAFGIAAGAFALTCAVLAALFGHTSA